MKVAMSVTWCSFTLAACLTTLGAQADKKPSRNQAEAKAAQWLDKLGPDGLVLNKTVAEGEGGFVAGHTTSGIGRETVFSFKQDGWRVLLFFRGELSSKTPLKKLQRRLRSIVLDPLPTPGLALFGWDVRPQTPVSSFKDGVEILAYGDGKMKIRVRTKFFALYGRDPSVEVLQDAPAPPNSYFQIRKDFPLDLTLEAPFAF